MLVLSFFSSTAMKSGKNQFVFNNGPKESKPTLPTTNNNSTESAQNGGVRQLIGKCQ